MQFPSIPMSVGFQIMPVTVQQPQKTNLMMAQKLNGPILLHPGVRSPISFPSEPTEAFTPTEKGVQLPVKGNAPESAQNTALLRAQTFTPMTESDIASTLTGLKIPLTQENITLAKGMLEHGLTLTTENFREMNETLAMLPKRLPSDMQAATFLKLSNLPITSHNVTVLSNFITSHPLIGAQLFEIQFEFRKFVDGNKRVSKDIADMLGKVPGIVGEYILDGKNNTRTKNSKAFQKMAQQVGIEKMGEGWWQDDEMDLMRMLISLRSKLSKEGMGEEESVVKKLIQLLLQIEENIAAQQLINTGKKNNETSFYYAQLPMRLDEKEMTAEVRIYYTTDYQENSKIDEDQTIIEFSVTSEHLGALYFHLEINHGIINVDVGTRDEEVRAFVEKYLPALMENMKKLAYTPAQARSYVAGEVGHSPQIIEVQQFEKLERVDLQC